MRYAVAVFAVVSVVVAAVRGSGPTGPDLRVVSDSVAIQGTWEWVGTIDRNGKTVTYEIRDRWIFRHGHFTVMEPKQRRPVEGTYELDRQRHPPSLVIRLPFERPVVSAYRLQGNVLHLTNSQGIDLIFQRAKPPL